MLFDSSEFLRELEKYQEANSVQEVITGMQQFISGKERLNRIYQVYTPRESAFSTEDAIRDELKRVFTTFQNIPDNTVFTDDLHFIETFQLDSLDLLELLFETEDAFDVEITDEEGEKIQTFGQIVALLQTKLKIK